MAKFEHDSQRSLDLNTVFAAQHSVSYHQSSDPYRMQRPSMDLSQAESVTASVERINHLIEEFERCIWFNGGLQKQVVDTSERGLSGKSGDVQLLTYVIAGRCMITFRSLTTGADITVVTADDEKPFQRRSPQDTTKMGPMGLQSLNGTEAQACELVRTIIESPPKMKADRKVSMA